jgi:hypothetical protein
MAYPLNCQAYSEKLIVIDFLADFLLKKIMTKSDVFGRIKQDVIEEKETH